MFWKVFVGLKCVRISRIPCLLNLSPLKTVVSRNFTSLSEISAVNLIVGCCLFARTMESSIYFCSTLHSENMSSMYLFHWSGFVLLKLIFSVSTADIKMFAKETAILYPLRCRVFGDGFSR